MAEIDRRIPIEEVTNSITHGIGLGLSLIGLVVLLTLALLHGSIWHLVSCSVYGGTLVTLYLASTLYHSFQSPRAKRLLRVIDHIAIYLLIAGTYTPFTLVTLRGSGGWVLFGLIWGLAVGGILSKLFLAEWSGKSSVAFYLVMGWLAVIAIKPLLALFPVAGLVWIFAGGLAYTIGVVFFAWERLPFNHTIWHLFVLAGSACHYLAVVYYVLPAKD